MFVQYTDTCTTLSTKEHSLPRIITSNAETNLPGSTVDLADFSGINTGTPTTTEDLSRATQNLLQNACKR